MRLLRQSVWLTSVLFSIGSYASTTFDRQELTDRFQNNLHATVTDIKASDIDGLVEVHTNRGTFFASPQGNLFIAGKLYGFDKEGGVEDVLAKRQAPINAEKIEQMSDQMIVYKAKNEKYVVTVFTDITCGYCVKLHHDIQKYNDLGITIRYLAFPRQGPNSDVAQQMAAIWCAKDRKTALNDAKLNHKLPEHNALFEQCVTRINQQYHLGVEMGMQGTPAIFLPDGEMLGGYLPPQQLLQRLEQKNESH